MTALTRFRGPNQVAPERHRGFVWQCIGRPAAVVVVVVVVASCGSDSRSAENEPARAATPSPPASAAPEPPPPAAPGPRTLTQVHHVASFRQDELDECTDFEVTYQVSASLPDWAPSARPNLGGDGATPIQRPCAEQFAGRTVLATCAIRAERSEGDQAAGEVRQTLAINSSYYRYATTFEEQGYMRDCLGASGDWQAVADTSDEYRRARLDFHARELRRAAKRLR